MSYLTILKSIKKDKRSGASIIYEKALLMFENFFKETSLTTPEEISKKFMDLSIKLLKAQPTMAPLIRLVNEISILLENSPHSFGEVFFEFVVKKKKEIKRNKERLREAGVSILEKKVILMTNSYSSSVFEILKGAAESGKELKVFCTLSPPIFEGIKLAEDLAKSHISVRLIEDHAISAFIKEVDMVMVGTDAILEKGFVNKIGTFPLALSAHYFQIPFFVVSTLDKFLPTYLEKLFKIETEKVNSYFTLPSHLKIIGQIFEFTPFIFVKNLITEEGVKEIKIVRNIMDSITISNMLKNFLEKGGAYEGGRKN